jgi:hypothetical protein
MTTTNFKRAIGTLITVGIACSVIAAQALTVSPAKAELTADPGETIQESFLIINENDNEQTYYTTIKKFEAQGETGTPNFVASKEGLPSWIAVQEKVTLKKGERVKIPYSVTVPQGAEPGGNFAAIFLSTVPPSAGEGEVSVGAELGMLVLLKVTGDAKVDGGLLSFIIKENKKVITSIPVEFRYRFGNKGGDRLKPEGFITIKNMVGGELAKLDANKSMGNVLPSSVRAFDVKYGEVVAPAVSAPFFEHVSFQMDNFALGMYTATLDLAFGDKKTASSSVTYFVFPWQLLTVVGISLLVIVILLVVLLKQYNRWIIKQARAAAK